MDTEVIKEGDLVDVYWEQLEPLLHATVLYVPCATGDSWHLRSHGELIVYVQTFNKMVKKKGY